MDSLSTEQRDAYDAVLRGESIFLTGPGGTGKSHLIRLLVENIPSPAITAMTGCAAVLLGHGAKTFHSWAGIGLGKETAEVCAKKMKSQAKKRWKDTNTLILDEVSMLTPELLEMIDTLAKLLRGSSKPMGGLQVIFVGDFLQLPPVAKGGNVKFAFESPVWWEIIKKTVILKRIFRQQDTTFQRILDESRLGQLSTDSLAILKTRCDLSWDHEPIQPTLLFSRNVQVDSINKANIDSLAGESHIYKARFPSGQSLSDEMGFVPELLLKVGAQVMLVTNLDQAKGLVNGSRGVVTEFRKDIRMDVETGKEMTDGKLYPVVKFRNGRLEMIKYHSWRDLFVEQVPLRLAYALTIHKAQGATLDCALIDIGPSTFEYGQAYVALSRVKSLDSLYVHEVAASAFRAHPLVKMFYAGTYQQPAQREQKPVSSVMAIPDVKRIPPIKGKNASYGFDDDKPVQQQASLKDYFGVPKPVVEPVEKSNKPARHGKAWDDEEIIKMLMAIRKKKSEQEISAIHERTKGSIHSKLKALAVDYYNNDKKPVTEIEKITGLSNTVIQEAIAKNKKTENPAT
jgi:ATP-dependent DNA helicase PIF1